VNASSRRLRLKILGPDFIRFSHRTIQRSIRLVSGSHGYRTADGDDRLLD
jgi:hypothetical protein